MLELLRKNKMFRVLLSYQFFSAIGGAMFSMFILLSVHLIYENPIFTGIAGFLMAAPRMISFLVGPIVDRRNKVAIMRLTTFLEFLVLALLAFTPLQESFGVLFMFAVIFVYNMAALFENPAGTAYLPQIVQEDEILRANSMINIIAMAGGIMIGIVLFSAVRDEVNFTFLFGFSAVFIALAFCCSLFLKHPGVRKTVDSKPNYATDLKEGGMFIKSNLLFYAIIAVVVMGFFGEISYVNRPQFLEYHVGAQGYVVYIMMALIGGIIASSIVGKFGNKFKLGWLVFILFLLTAVARVVFVLALPSHYIGGFVMAIMFSALATSIGIIFTTLNQKAPPENMVGRVDTITSTFVAVAATVGALVGGFLGSIVPVVDHIFIFQGISYIVVGTFLFLVPSFRRLPRLNEIKKQ